jgi:hypothetical protein
MWQRWVPDTPDASVDVATEAIEKLPHSMKARVQFDPQTREIGVTRTLSRDDRNLMQLAFAKVKGANRVIDWLFHRVRNVDRKPNVFWPQLSSPDYSPRSVGGCGMRVIQCCLWAQARASRSRYRVL